MHHGWIKVYRCLLDDPLWQCGTPEQKVILITLLLMANHTENKWEWNGKPYICRPGQMITSLKSIQEKCGKKISIPQIRRALKRFEAMGFIVSTAAKDHRMITICNWERYQCTNPSTDIPTVKNVSDSSQVAVMSAPPNKNEKNSKNEKKSNPASSFSLSFEEQDAQRAAAANADALATFLNKTGDIDNQ